MIDLLSNTSLFLMLENSCLVQLAGIPVAETLKYIPDKTNKGKVKKPSEISISRHRIFYGRPLFYSTTKKVYAIGLPSTRRFEIFTPSMSTYGEKYRYPQ